MTQGILKKLETNAKTTYFDALSKERYNGSMALQIRGYNQGQKILGLCARGKGRSRTYYHIYKSPLYKKDNTSTELSIRIDVKTKKSLCKGNEPSRLLLKITYSLNVTGLGEDINTFLDEKASELFNEAKTIFKTDKYDLYLEKSEREVKFNEHFGQKVI